MRETKKPIFKTIFGQQWDSLPSVMQKHYANRPMSKDEVTVDGFLKVEISFLFRLLSPLFRLTGSLVPYAADRVPVTVHFRSEPESNAYCFDRIFYFPEKRPYSFRSRMVPVGGDEVVEFMSIGIGWHARYRYDGQKVLLEHRGYRMKWFGTMIRLPLELFLGEGYAEECALNDEEFSMYMEIRHALLGRLYAYSGSFKVTNVRLDE